MAARRMRKVSQDLDGQPDGQQSDDQKIKLRKALFIQQFEKEANDRINEMETNLNKLLATVDRVFKVELMKMPQSLHTTLIKDLMSDRDTSFGEVTMAITCASPEFRKPLTLKPSKKGLSDMEMQQKSSTSNKSTAANGPKKSTKKTLHSSKSTGSLRCDSTISAKRTQGRVMKPSDQRLGLGGVAKRAGTRLVGDEMMASGAIVTSHGDTLFLSEDNKDDINVEQLDDVALGQMRKIKDLMDYLCHKLGFTNTC